MFPPLKYVHKPSVVNEFAHAFTLRKILKKENAHEFHLWTISLYFRDNYKKYLKLRRSNANYTPNAARIHETLELLETNPLIRTKEELTQKERTKFGLFSNNDISTIGKPTNNDEDVDETILIAFRKSVVLAYCKEMRREEPLLYIDPPDGVSRATWLDDEKEINKDEEPPKNESKLFEFEISSIRKRTGERRYLRGLRLGSMTNIIKYHDENTFGFTFMINPFMSRNRFDYDEREYNPFMYNTAKLS